MGENDEAISRLLFMRHGDADVPPNCYPNHDTMPLSTLGLKQALDAAAALERVGISRIVASPFRRATQTAEIVAEKVGIPVAIDHRLRERTLEHLYGVSYQEISQKYGQPVRIALETGQSHLACLDGMESMTDCVNRVSCFVEDLAHRLHRTTLAIAHGGPHDWLLARLLGVDPLSRWFSLGKGRLSVFDFYAGTAKLQRVTGLNLTASDYAVSVYQARA